MASLDMDDAQSNFDVATSLFIQCRMAHQELQRVASKEGKLLNRLCDELQNLRKSQVPEGFEVALRSDSEFEVPLQPELKSYNPDTSRMTTKIAVVDSSLSESPKLPQIYFPVSERSSEALMDERVMMERQSERPSQDSNECSKVPSRRISIHSTESAKNAMKSRRSLSTAKLEIENPVQSYSISGINRKDLVAPRSTMVSLMKSNLVSTTEQDTGWLSQQLLSMADSLERCWQIEEPERRGCLARVVRSNLFGAVCGAVIFVNAIFICFATDYEMMNLSPVVSPEDQVSMAELWLASFYVVELALKLVVHGFYFFWNSEMAWNWFDFILVLFSIIENILVFDLFGTSAESGGSGVNLGFLRLLRLCKIVKILRVFRTLRFFSELRLMLDCVVGSLMNVFWCLIMLIFVMYVFALLLQQGVVQYLQERTADGNDGSQIGLQTYFSSVGVTVVTLFQSCTSGVDWSEPYKALQPTGWVLPISFLLYIAFVFISVWNIVTSSFVEKALKLAQPDVDMLILEQQLQDFEDCRMLAKLFKKMLKTDAEGHERLGLDEFRKLVETHDFRSYLQTRGIDIKNAETFFKMLVELQGEDTIDASTFANACVRMKGAATSIDLQTVMFTTHLMNKEQRRAFQNLFARLVRIESVMNADTFESVDFEYPISEDSQEGDGQL